jgi:Zn-dependent protease with chaperone function
MIAELALAVAALVTPVSPNVGGDWHIEAEQDEAHATAKWLSFYTNAPTLPRNTYYWRYNAQGEPGSWALAQIMGAMQDWQHVCPGVRFVFLGATTTGFAIDGVSTISWMPMDITYGGYTIGSVKRNKIIESDVALNNLNMTTPDAVRAITRHEIGHVLGLAHSDVKGAAMSGPPFSTYAWPYVIAPDDIKGCRELYD